MAKTTTHRPTRIGMAERRMKKIIRKYSRDSPPPSDLEYWLSRPVAERIEAVYFLVRMQHGQDYGSPQGLQRVYTITQRKGR